MASKIDIVIEAVDNLSGTVKKIERNLETMSRKAKTSMKKVEASSKQMSAKTVASLDKMNSAFGVLSTNMRRIGALVGSIYAVRSALTGLADVADDFKDFNEAMAYTNTIAQLTAEQLADLTLQVEELSIALGKSAPEMAMGLYDIYSSGFEGAEAMKVLEVATNGAIAGLTKTEIAAKGLMAVMNAYNRKTGPDAVDIMDSMFKTVDKGVVTFPELASEIGSVVTIASQLGIPFDQISAAMSEMTLRGLSAAESATALEGLMRSLMKPADQTKDAVKRLNKENKDLNFEWNVATLRAKGLDGMMKDLNKAAQGNFEVVGKIVPSIRGLRSAMVLASNDGEGFSQMLEEQANRAGATGRALVEANKSVNRQLEITRTEWEKYKREVGESIAGVELFLMDSALTFGKWSSSNKESIIYVARAIKDLTVAFVAFKVVIGSVAVGGALNRWLTIQAVAFLTFTTNIGKATVSLKALRALVFSMTGLKITIGIALVGYTLIMRQLKSVQIEAERTHQRLLDLSEYRKEAKQIEKSFIEDEKYIQKELTKATEEGNKDRTNKLNEYLVCLEKWRDKQRGFMLFPKPEKGDPNFEFALKHFENREEAMAVHIEKMTELSKELGLTGVKVVTPGMGEITIPEYGDFPTMEDLLGPDADEGAEKVLRTIKKINKKISEYYSDLGDYADEQAETMEDQSDAFADLALDFSRYLEDIDIDLDRMSAKHKQVISDIRDDIADENRDFAESMDERARKFEATMASMATRHTDKVDDIQHQINLELGMGIRADKEKLRELQKRLNRENRDYKDKVAKDKEEKESEDQEDRDSNAEKLSDFEERLNRETTAYEQKSDDIKRLLDREIFDYSDQQNTIRNKTQETLRGIVEDYQKAYKDIFEAIRESGVPSLLAKLPELMETATATAIRGVQNIPRNIVAEEEFVKGWGGLHGRLPSAEEISMGVYGTPTGPNNPVNVTINNPVVLDESYTDNIIQQIQIELGNAQRLQNQGAY